MRLIFKYSILLFVCFLLLSCFSSKRAGKEEKTKDQAADTTLFASIQRTSCYGRCPAYTATIYQSGRVVYEGKHFVEKEGKYEAQMSRDKMDMLLVEAKKINYFELADKYDSNVTDLPACITVIQADGKRKQIYNRHEGPPELRTFQQTFDQILDGLEWTKAETPEQKESELND